MKAFRYVAIDGQGRRLVGSGYAADSAALRDQLVDARLHPLAIRPLLFQGSRRLALSEAEGARFARDLAQLLGSGLSIIQALGLLVTRETPRVAAIAREVRARLSAGEPLSVALGAAEGRPARFLQAMARAGEASGRQGEALASGAQSLAASDALKKRLVTLTLYPAFVVLIAAFSIAIYAYAVLPSLEPAFATMGDDLPAQTRTVLVFGAVVRAITPVLGILGGATTVCLLASSRARMLAQDLTARFLMRGKTAPLRDYIFANLASRLAVMLQAGVPLSAAWKLARDPVTVASVSRSLEAQDTRLMEGARLSDVLGFVKDTPADLIHYVALGEQSGQIAKALADSAAALGARSQEAIERWLSVLTPLVIMLVGAMVGAITLMVFQGLLAVGDAVAV